MPQPKPIDMSQYRGRNGDEIPTKLVDQNVEQENIITKDGALENRPGAKQIGTTAGTGSGILGLGTWGDNLVRAFTTTLEIFTSDWYDIKTGLTTGSRMSFLEYYDDLYCSNQVDTVFKAVKTQLNGALSGAETVIVVDAAYKFAPDIDTTTTIQNFATKTGYIDGDAFTYRGVSSGTIVAKTFADTPYTASTETTINYDTSGGASAVNLPAGVADKIYIIRLSVAGNNLTITPNGAETINSAASVVLSTANDYIIIKYDGTSDWEITNHIVANSTKLDLVSGVLAHDDDLIVTTTFDLTSVPKGLGLAEYGEKFWVDNIAATADTPTLPFSTKYSVTVNAVSPEQFYDFTSSGAGTEFIAERGESRAVTNFRDNLLIGFTDGIKYVSGFSDATPPVPIITDLYKKDGVINERCMSIVGADVVYFTGKRIRRVFVPEGFDGINEDIDFDKPMLDILQDLNTDQSEANMSYNDKTGELYLHVKQKGSTINDLRIVYSTAEKSWWTEPNTFGNDIVVLDGVTYYASSISGDVYERGGIATRAGGSDLMFFESKHAQPFVSRRYDWFWFYLRGKMASNTEITVKCYVDNNLIQTATVTTEDFINEQTITSHAIGDHPVGDDMWGGGLPDEQEVDVLQDFEKWIPVGRHGQVFYYTLTLNGAAQRFQIYNSMPHAIIDPLPSRRQSSI